MDGFQIIKKWRLNSSFWPSTPLLVWFQPRILTLSPACPIAHGAPRRPFPPAFMFCAFPCPCLCSLYSCSLECHSFVYPTRWNLSFQAHFRCLIHQETTSTLFSHQALLWSLSTFFLTCNCLCINFMSPVKQQTLKSWTHVVPLELGYIYRIIY